MYKFFKRFFDIVFSVCFILAFWWIYIIAYIGIKISSPGPAIYKAKRVGEGGKVFNCYKFRSMRVDSGKVRLTTLKNDDRIFPFGNFIRKTKIDEMPQIFNIFSGEMTVVGPRPEDVANADKMYQGVYKKILSVKPGLTSPASLYDYTHGEFYEDEELYEKEFLPEKLKLELYYVEHCSFFYDIKIILRTALCILLRFCGKHNFSTPLELQKAKTYTILEKG